MDSSSEGQQADVDILGKKFTRRQVLEGVGITTAAAVAAGTLLLKEGEPLPVEKSQFQLLLGKDRFDITRTYDDSFLKPEPTSEVWSPFASQAPNQTEEKKLLTNLWNAYTGNEIQKPSNDQRYMFHSFSKADKTLYGVNDPSLIRLRRGRIPFAYAGKELMNESGQNMLVYIPANTSFEYTGDLDIMQLPPQKEGIDPSALAWGLAIEEAKIKPNTSLTICQPYSNPAGVVKIEPIVAYQIEPAKPLSRFLGTLGLK